MDKYKCPACDMEFDDVDAIPLVDHYMTHHISEEEMERATKLLVRDNLADFYNGKDL